MANPRGLLQQLEREQGDLKKELAIIRISEPISDVGNTDFSPSKRGSDVSITNLNDPTPASLESDLTHYKVRNLREDLGSALFQHFTDRDPIASFCRNSFPNYGFPILNKLPRKSSSAPLWGIRRSWSDTMRMWNWRTSWPRSKPNSNRERKKPV